MIRYDSHKACTLFGLSGSVLPRAMTIAIPSALLGFMLKSLERLELIELDPLTVLTEGSVYSGFTFVLGFSLVFRTSQAYGRFWTAATSVHEMGSEWCDACASLIVFGHVSKHKAEDVLTFQHTIVRLFSLLHATALEDLSELADPHFPVLGITSVTQEDLVPMHEPGDGPGKVHVVLCWIKSCIIQAVSSGLLDVPAPILTRVFQEMGMGLVEYHRGQQVVIWPFPYPYTQLNLLMIYVYCLLTPLVICSLDTEAWLSPILCLISIVAMISLDLIASELENPFGEDPNDLPVYEMHDSVNRFLLLQMNPAVWKVPTLNLGGGHDPSTMAYKLSKDLGSTRHAVPQLPCTESSQPPFAELPQAAADLVDERSNESRCSSGYCSRAEVYESERMLEGESRPEVYESEKTLEGDRRPKVSKSEHMLEGLKASDEFLLGLTQKLEEQSAKISQHVEGLLERQVLALELVAKIWKYDCGGIHPPIVDKPFLISGMRRWQPAGSDSCVAFQGGRERTHSI